MSDDDETEGTVTTLDTTRRPRARTGQGPTRPATPPGPDVTPRRRGRPTVMNAVVTEAIVSAIALGAPFTAACEFSGVSPSVGRNWRRRAVNALHAVGIDADGDQEYDSDLALEMLHPEDRPFVEFLWDLRSAKAEGMLANLAKIRNADDWRSSAWVLERTTEEFRPPRHEISGAGGGPIEIDARAAILAALDRRREAATAAQDVPEAVGGATTARKPRKAVQRKGAPK